jgi:hypothetical protein
MKTFTLSVAVAVAFSAPPIPSAQAPTATPRPFGASVNGVQLGISVTSSGTAVGSRPEFEVALQNAGDSDFVLNLGTMLANGKVMWPDAIRLMLIDPAGQGRELRFSSRKYAGVAGRIDDFTVALRGGSVYTLRISLADYWSPSTRDFDLKLANGRYKVAAQFEGRRATGVNLDMQGVALMNFWTGKVQSNVAEFEVSNAALAK